MAAVTTTGYVLVISLVCLSFCNAARTSLKTSSSSRSSSSSSYRSSYRTSTFRSRSGYSYSSAVNLGIIYGYSRYSTRYRSYDADSDPTVCENYYDQYNENGTSYSLFICPLDNQPDDYNYCCGASDKQQCCNFWQDPGRLAGLIVGLIVAVAVIVIIFICCWRRSKRRAESLKQGHAISLQSTNAERMSVLPLGSAPPPATYTVHTPQPYVSPEDSAPPYPDPPPYSEVVQTKHP